MKPPLRLVLIEGCSYTVLEGRKVVARLVDVDHHGVSPQDVEAARVADYPPLETKD
ncbi:MAG: hypothetical protein JSS14_21925 [Proteobacteria bacterium]|nr:hypothetical protein [Pseudomonadota bacterium]